MNTTLLYPTNACNAAGHSRKTIAQAVAKKLLLVCLTMLCFAAAKGQGQSWQALGPDDANQPSTSAVQYTNIATDSNGVPYVVYEDGGNSNKATVMKYNGSSWVTVGAAGFSAGAVTYTTMAFNGSTPYVTYRDGGNSGKATVMMYNGSNWVTVGSAGFSTGTIAYTSLAFNGSTPYVAYEDAGNGNKAMLMMYNGTNWVAAANPLGAGAATYISLAFNGGNPYIAFSDAGDSNKARLATYNGSIWVTVGTEISSANTATYTSLAFNSGNPYVLYADAGNRATVKMYNGSSWVTVGAADFSAGQASYCSLVFNGGTPYAVYRDNGHSNKTTVVMYNGSSWVPVGTAGFSAGIAAYTSLAFSGSTPYVVYEDAGNSNKATVMMYNGSGWVVAGTTGVGVGTAAFTSLVFNGSTPYLAYEDVNNGGKVTVMMYNGSNWVTVGTAGFSAGAASYCSLAFNGSTPYVAYEDGGNGSRATVMMYNGSSWVTVGTAGFSAGAAAYCSLAFNGSTPYVAYKDGGNNNAATVMMYDGSNWVPVGAAGFSAGAAFYTSLAFNGGNPYVVYEDINNNFQATMMTFDGSNWVTVGTAGFSAGQATSCSLVFNGSIPYVAYEDAGNSSKATVMTYDGSNWVPVGTAGFSAGAAISTSLAFNGSTPYVAYEDGGNANKASVMMYNGSSWVPVGTAGFSVGPVTYPSLALNGGKPYVAYVNNGVYVKYFGINAPATQATNVTFSNTTASASTVSWTNGDGGSRAVFMAAATSGSPGPFNLTAYNANAAFASGDQINSTGWYCVYNGTGSTVDVTGLTAGTTYRVMAVEYNGTGSNVTYLTTTGTGNPAAVTTATTVAAITPAGTSPTNATTLDYTVTFANALTTPPSTADFTLTGGATGTINSVTGSGTTYDVNVTNVSGNGSLELDMTGGSDASPTISNVPFTGGAYTIDNTSPTALTLNYSSNHAGNSQVAAVGDVISLDFSTTEAINVPSLSIAGHAVTATNVGGNEWLGTYTITNSDTEGRVPFTLSFNDLAGNPQPGAAYGDVAAGDDIEFDKTAPTATISAPSAASIGNNGTGTVSYTVTYADANFNTSNLTGAGITLTNPTGTATGTVTVTGSGTSYTVTISNISGLGTLGISLAGGYASDQAGNTDAGAGPSATFIVGSSDASLSNLQVDAGALKPGFASGTTSYSLVLGSGASSVTLTPTSNDANATITVNGNPVTSGSGDVISLVAGVNNVSVVVTAQDGVTSKTYSLTIARASSANTNLITIRPSIGGLTPAFSSTTISYTSSVGNGGTTITVTPTTGDPQATIKVNGVSLADGSTSAPVSLNVGTNAIAIEVTSADGIHRKTYNLTVTRAPSSNALLSSLVPSRGVKTSGFVPLSNNLAVTVGNAITSIMVTPTSRDATATVTVNGVAVTSGTASATIPLNVGDNTITTVVTAQDMTTTNTYTMVVTRAMSSNANLITIRPNHGTLSPVFSSAVTTYAIAVAYGVSSITVAPGTQDATAHFTVNNSPLASGTTTPPISLNVGDNPIAILVTAQDGTQKTYTVTVTRAMNPVNAAYEPISVSNPAGHPQMMGDEINVHQGLSPNGDGINDFLLIDGINNYPDNKLQIMNRSGALVFEAKGYDNSTKVFDGHSNKNGAMQLPGTYFYSLDFTANGVTQHKTGFIVLKY